MSETGLNLEQQSITLKVNRGGDKKVMKKSLSVLVAGAMVSSMLASAVYAADAPLDTQAKYDALVAAGIFEGTNNGAELNAGMTREQLAKIVALLKKFPTPAVTSTGYDDVAADRWSASVIAAVSKAQPFIMDGTAPKVFAPEGTVTIEQLATVLVRALDIKVDASVAVTGTVADWAKANVAAVVKLGLLEAKADYTVDAPRSILVDATYAVVQELAAPTVKSSKVVDSKKVSVTMSDDVVVDVTLETALEVGKATEVKFTYKNRPYSTSVTYAALEVAKAELKGAKKIVVTFNGAVSDTSKAVATLTTGAFTTATTSSWNDAKTELTLVTVNNLPTGEATVAISGLDIPTGKETAKVTVAPERIEVLTLDDNGFRGDGVNPTTGPVPITTVTVGYKALNQYGEDITSSATFAASAVSNFTATTSVGNIGAGVSGDPSAKGTITLTNVAADKTTVVVTLVDETYAKSVSKSVNIQNARVVSEITISAPTLKTGKDTLSATTANKLDYVIPYTAKDQFGNSVTLVAADLAKITFISSATGVLADTTPFKINSDKKLTVDFKEFDGKKEVTLTAIANASGKSSQASFTLYGNATASEPLLVAPTTRFGAGETNYQVELQLKDVFGATMTADQIIAAAPGLTITSGNQAKYTVAATAVTKVDNKAYVQLNGVEIGDGVLTVTVNSTGKSSSLPISVVAAKVANALTIVPSVTSSVYNAVTNSTITVKATFVDQYAAAFPSAVSDTNAVVKVTANVDDAFNNVSVAGTTYSIYNLINTGITGITPKAADKSVTLTFRLYSDATAATSGDVSKLIDTKTVTLTSQKADADLTYTVTALGTLSTFAAGNAVTTAGDAATGNGKYAKTVAITAKDASGAVVSVPSDTIQNVTAADTNAITVNGKVIAAKGTADVNTFVNVTYKTNTGAIKTVAVPVTVSKAAPAAASLVAKAGSTVKTTFSLATGTAVANLFDTTNTTIWFEAKDQYAAVNAPNVVANVAIYVTDPTGAITKLTGNNYTFATAGKYTLTAVVGELNSVVTVTVQ